MSKGQVRPLRGGSPTHLRWSAQALATMDVTIMCAYESGLVLFRGESGEKVRFLCALLAVLCLCLVFTLCDFLVDTRETG